MNIIGQMLLWAGFLSGSLATVLNVEDDKIPWSTIPWGWYLASVSICVVGIVLLRLGRTSTVESTEESTASLSEIRGSLLNLLKNTQQMSGQMDELAPSEMTVFIDDVLSPDCYIFAEGRNAITTEMGLQKFADVMTHFSAAERAVNRAWSAAADGYVDEAKKCVERAVSMFEDAYQELG